MNLIQLHNLHIYHSKNPAREKIILHAFANTRVELKLIFLLLIRDEKKAHSKKFSICLVSFITACDKRVKKYLKSSLLA